MTKPRKHLVVEPATMTWAEVSEYAFRKGESWLRAHLTDFTDFPRPDPSLGLFRKLDVDFWLGRRFGEVTSDVVQLESELIRRARRG